MLPCGGLRDLYAAPRAASRIDPPIMTNWLSSVVAGEDADGDILSLLAGVVSPKGSRLDRNYRTDCSAA